MTEMIIIAVVALIFIGPDQIPEVARTVGRLMNDLRRSTDEIKRDFHQQSGLPKNFEEWLETKKQEPDPPENFASPSNPKLEPANEAQPEIKFDSEKDSSVADSDTAAKDTKKS